jgi:hypothetical protein
MRRAGALFPLLALAPLLASLLASLGACSDNQPALPPVPEKKEKLTRFEFALDNVRYAISLPEQAGMREARNPKLATFDARNNQRLQKIMELGSAPPRPQPSPDRQYRLRNGSIVKYHKTDDAGGGSGGAMATIEGEFEIGLYTLFLYCSDQGEWALYPDWCLEHLETIELIPAPSGNG